MCDVVSSTQSFSLILCRYVNNIDVQFHHWEFCQRVVSILIILFASKIKSAGQNKIAHGHDGRPYQQLSASLTRETPNSVTCYRQSIKPPPPPPLTQTIPAIYAHICTLTFVPTHSQQHVVCTRRRRRHRLLLSIARALTRTQAQASGETDCSQPHHAHILPLRISLARTLSLSLWLRYSVAPVGLIPLRLVCVYVCAHVCV